MSLTRIALPAVLICVATLFAPALAAAETPSWSKSPMSAAATYFPAGTSAMVVGVGPSAQPVAAELVKTLQTSDALELVIDARALGNIDALADDAIVKRAFARPIQRVAIVRVFPAAGSVKAVVTVYGAEGQVTTAFTVSPGRALAENPTPEAAEDGVRRDEMVSVQGKSAGTVEGENVITYERQHLTGVTAYGVVTLENVSFFKNGRLISDTPSLYEALGMTAEASDYRTRTAALQSKRKKGAAVGGIGLLGVIGFGTWALVAASDKYDYNTNMKIERSATVPLLFTAGSAVMMYVGFRMMLGTPPKNLTAEEAVSLVDAHNQKKRRTTDAGSRFHDVTLAPTAMPSGGGLVLGGSF
ncbi:MAG: hypothetical protein JWP01_2632 [Myxococcales bacterium]|nr:hypothetical protein [Myxococcales bacterium]